MLAASPVERTMPGIEGSMNSVAGRDGQGAHEIAGGIAESNPGRAVADERDAATLGRVPGLGRRLISSPIEARTAIGTPSAALAVPTSADSRLIPPPALCTASNCDRSPASKP